LEATRYVMQTVVNQAEETDNLLERLFGGDQLLLIAEGEVVAGFDLQKVKARDIVAQGRAITLTLPPPEILFSRVDNEKTYVYERKTGLLRRPDPNLETEARQLAERRLVEWALERDILAQAEASGLFYLENFLRSLGFSEVTIEVSSAASEE